MRQDHYWKKAFSKELPRHIVCFDCETLPTPIVTADWHPPKRVERWNHKFRLAVCQYGHIRNGKYVRRQNEICYDNGLIKKMILDRCNQRDKLWVIGHNIAYDIGAAGLWDWLQSDTFNFDRVILDNHKFLLEGYCKGKPIAFCDTGNYTLTSLAQIGKDIGFAKMEMPQFDATDSEWIPYCQRDVDVTVRFFTDLVLWIAKENMGPFSISAASLAFNTFRKRFMRHKVLVHDCQFALDIERQSYFGGLVETPYIGTVKDSPIYEVDIQSMYPYCCTKELPTRLVRIIDRPTMFDLKASLQQYMVFAEVTISSGKYSFPIRTRKRVYHPVGTYRCVLADPELRYAHDRYLVQAVHRLSCHEFAPIFRKYMQFFFELKDRYSQEGNESYRSFAKLMMNSLYGKTGQLSHRWMQWGRESLQLIERKYNLADGTLKYLDDQPPLPPTNPWQFDILSLGVSIVTRWNGFVTEIEIDVGESRDSVPSIAACVTSYARLRLRQMQQIAGEKNWFYSDTDSLWINKKGLEALLKESMIREGCIGFFGRPKIYQSLTIHGPKDYEAIAYEDPDNTHGVFAEAISTFAAGDTTRRKGIRSTAEQIDETHYEQLAFPGPMTQLLDDVSSGVIVASVIKELRRECHKYHLDSSGKTSPFILPRDKEYIR